jgi:UDP-N-acetylglucosamine 2-epimerase (non-hydrolysing)
MDMPKEANRMITDGLSDILFTASMSANRNLNQTGTEQKHVHFVGNILMDTLRHNYNRFIKPNIFTSLNLQEKQYILLTLNRRSLIEKEETLSAILRTLQTNTSVPIIAPVHNYIKERIAQLDINPNRIHIIEPQPYLSFGYLTSHAKAIVTDSGNVAEEATFMGIPCITLNNYAEHPETASIGSNFLAGEDGEALAEALQLLEKSQWKKSQLPERWDGRTAERIVQTLLEKFE